MILLSLFYSVICNPGSKQTQPYLPLISDVGVAVSPVGALHITGRRASSRSSTHALFHTDWWQLATVPPSGGAGSSSSNVAGEGEDGEAGRCDAEGTDQARCDAGKSGRGRNKADGGADQIQGARTSSAPTVYMVKRPFRLRVAAATDAGVDAAGESSNNAHTAGSYKGVVTDSLLKSCAATWLADERKQALAPTGQPTPARAGPDDTSTNNYKKADNEDAKDGSSDLKDQRVCKIGQLCCFMEGHVYESFIWQQDEAVLPEYASNHEKSTDLYRSGAISNPDFVDATRKVSVRSSPGFNLYTAAAGVATRVECRRGEEVESSSTSTTNESAAPKVVVLHMPAPKPTCRQAPGWKDARVMSAVQVGIVAETTPATHHGSNSTGKGKHTVSGASSAWVGGIMLLSSEETGYPFVRTVPRTANYEFNMTQHLVQAAGCPPTVPVHASLSSSSSANPFRTIADGVEIDLARDGGSLPTSHTTENKKPHSSSGGTDSDDEVLLSDTLKKFLEWLPDLRLAKDWEACKELSHAFEGANISYASYFVKSLAWHYTCESAILEAGLAQLMATPPFGGVVSSISEGLAPCCSVSAGDDGESSGGVSDVNRGKTPHAHAHAPAHAHAHARATKEGEGGDQSGTRNQDGGSKDAWRSEACRDAIVGGASSWALRQAHGVGMWIQSAVSDLLPPPGLYDRGVGRRASTGGSTGTDAHVTENGSCMRGRDVWDRPDGLPVQQALSLTASELVASLETEPEALTLVFVHAPWCPFSAEVAPLVLLYFAQRPGLRLVFVDGHGSPGLNSRYGVHGFPTLVLLRGQMLLGRFSGPQRYSEIGVFVEQTLNMTNAVLDAAATVSAEGEGEGKDNRTGVNKSEDESTRGTDDVGREGEGSSSSGSPTGATQAQGEAPTTSTAPLKAASKPKKRRKKRRTTAEGDNDAETYLRRVLSSNKGMPESPSVLVQPADWTVAQWQWSYWQNSNSVPVDVPVEERFALSTASERVGTATEQTYKALHEAVRDGEVGRAITLVQSLRVLSWYANGRSQYGEQKGDDHLLTASILVLICCSALWAKPSKVLKRCFFCGGAIVAATVLAGFCFVGYNYIFVSSNYYAAQAL